METPLISILMAVYNPRIEWFKEQLKSLNEQTYPNLRLYIRDDCSEKVQYKTIENLVRECITSFPFSIKQNSQNRGSNKTFELLSGEAEGTYFAYCDQDDIWSSNKIEILEAKIRKGVLAYSDMSVIDDEGETIADTIKIIRPRICYIEGEHLSEQYFFRNCTAGCSMLVRSDLAKKAIPFPFFTVCDQWIAMIAALDGKVLFSNDKLVAYRQHETNQTGILMGVKTKADYRRYRLEPLKERLNAYERIGEPTSDLKAFVRARLDGKIITIWKHRHFSPYEAKLEILTRLIPNRLFECLMKRFGNERLMRYRMRTN